MIVSSFGKERVYLADWLRFFTKGKAKAKTQGGSLKQNPHVNTAYWLSSPRLHSYSSQTVQAHSPRHSATYSGLDFLTSIINQPSPTKTIWWTHFFNWVSCFPGDSSCVKLTKENSPPPESDVRGKVCLGSWLKSLGHSAESGTAAWGSCHMVPTTKKQREMHAGAQPTPSFSVWD